MKITPLNVTFINIFNPDEDIITPTLPFFFVSDNYTAFQMTNTIINSCWLLDLVVDNPVPFNSTGNIRLEAAVQYFRGGSAAIFLPGYDNTKELAGNPNLVPNPVFPQNVSMDAWTCLNSTIGQSIPLMQGGTFPKWGIALCVLLPLFCIFGLLVYCGSEPPPTNNPPPINPPPADKPTPTNEPPPTNKLAHIIEIKASIESPKPSYKSLRMPSYASLPSYKSLRMPSYASLPSYRSLRMPSFSSLPP